MRPHFMIASTFLLAACGHDAVPASPPFYSPDGPPSNVPRDVAGTFAVESELDLPLPPQASAALVPITSAVDGVDDPSHYLLDRMVDQLPEGTLRTVARDAVPFLAPYLNARLTDIAPHLVGGLHAIADGLDRITRHAGLLETWEIDASGRATRIVTGARFATAATPVDVQFADHGFDDRVATMHVTIDAEGRLAIGDHQLPLGYAALIRLGLDHAVLPGVDPQATDLAKALTDLVDCTQLGTLVANELGIGTPAIYSSACVAATIAIANDVYTRIAAIDASMPLALELEGSATGIDADHDGSVDEVRGGSWSGTLVSVGPIGAATFSGARSK
jgi:hypothetical protein